MIMARATVQKNFLLDSDLANKLETDVKDQQSNHGLTRDDINETLIVHDALAIYYMALESDSLNELVKKLGVEFLAKRK